MTPRFPGPIVAAVVAAAFAVLPAAAQQVAATYGTPITLETAKKVVAAAEAEAKKNNWLMVITILDSGGNLVITERLDGTQYGSIGVAEGKARTALNFRRSTKVFQDGIAQGGANLRTLALPGVVPVQGGLPLIVGDKIVGAIGVSGGTSEQDEQVGLAGAGVLGK